MHRLARTAGFVSALVGALALIWVVVVWQWQDPFTGLYTRWQQHELQGQLKHEFHAYALRPTTGHISLDATGELREIERTATRMRRDSAVGQAIGRIEIPRLSVNMIVVNGTDDASLRRGPGRDLASYMPGQNRLVYIAGHRTTYLAPFSHIEQIQRGDRITIEMPYATFRYRAVRHRIVPATDLSVLRSPRHESLELQACNPRFFATQRYIVYARLASVEVQGSAPLTPNVLASARASLHSAPAG